MNNGNTKIRINMDWKRKKEPIEPRILIENKKLSYSKDTIGIFDQGTKDNLLIHGDNLLALRSLEKEYEGKVKCIYIDPPYNTGLHLNTMMIILNILLGFL